MGILWSRKELTIACDMTGDSGSSVEVNVSSTYVEKYKTKYNFVYKIITSDGIDSTSDYTIGESGITVNSSLGTYTHSGTTVTSSGASPANILDTSEANVGDVLTVGESGAEWAAPSGGGVHYYALRVEDKSVQPGSQYTLSSYSQGVKYYDIGTSTYFADWSSLTELTKGAFSAALSGKSVSFARADNETVLCINRIAVGNGENAADECRLGLSNPTAGVLSPTSIALIVAVM